MAAAKKPFVCSIEVSKTAGFSFKLQNDTGKTTQTITLDGTTLTITVKGEKSTSTVTQTAEQIELKVVGEQDTSTLTQTADQVEIKVKTFKVDAETVEIKSSKTSSYEATETLAMKSTKDMTIASSAKLAVSSTSDMSLASSAKLDQSATADATLKGNNTTVEAMLKLTAKGSSEVAVSGTKIGVTADAKLDLNSPMTTVGDTVTTIKGSAIKVEGSLVKLG